MKYAPPVFRILLPGLLALGLAACASPIVSSSSAKPASPDPAHNSRNALDWAGTYEGVTPCADCPGIRQRLTLQADGRYELSTEYLERPVAPKTVRGSFSWNTAGNTITLDAAGNGQQFRVGEGRLLQLDRDGKAPSWDTPYRVLNRLPSPAPTPAPAPSAAPTAANANLARGLEDHEWTLRAATDASGKPIAALLAGKPFVLRFSGTGLSVKGGCNTLFGRWQFTPQDVLVVSGPASTQMACEPALMSADAAMAKALASPLQAKLEAGSPPLLRLTTAAQQTLSFEGRRTLTAQHGAPTRVFLEVAAQRVPCTPALQPPTTCLQVRELRFDDQGLRAGSPGPWQAFYGEILGYTHVPGTSNVLRINRYTRQKPPADASAYVYELDLVVESRKDAK